jgi:hypothetical protein
MKLAKKILKFLFKKLDITLLKGDIRKELRFMGGEELPDKLLENARVVSSREKVLKYLPVNGVCIEVGVAYGEFSERIINELKPIKFIAIDAFGSLPIITNEGNRELDSIENSEHFKFYKEKFKEKISDGSLDMMRGYSWEMLEQLPDCIADYIYIDADHSYSSVVKDIEQAKKKLKPSGILQFNDYTCIDVYSIKPYGVYKAVNEFLIKDNFEIIYLCLHPFGFYDVVVKKIQR